MAGTVFTGSYAVFMGSTAFSAAQVDLVNAGKIPTSSGGYTWSRLFTAADAAASINREGESLELGTQEDGVLKSIVTDAGAWTMNIPIADVVLNTFKKLLQLNPTYYSSSGTGMPLNLNIQGTDLLTNGVPFMIVNKYYQNNSTEGTSVDTPVFTDPNTFVFCKGGLRTPNFTVNLDPSAQQVFDVEILFTNTTGVTNSNVGGWVGAVTKASS